jgi:hypothetical protein
MSQAPAPTNVWSLAELNVSGEIAEGLSDRWSGACVRSVAGRRIDPSWWGSLEQVPDGARSGLYRLRLGDRGTWIFLYAGTVPGTRPFIGAADLPRGFFFSSSD